MITEIKKDLEEMMNINRENIEKLQERDIRLRELEEKSKDLGQMAIAFQKSTEPWYYRIPYYSIGASILTVIGYFVA